MREMERKKEELGKSLTKKINRRPYTGCKVDKCEEWKKYHNLIKDKKGFNLRQAIAKRIYWILREVPWMLLGTKAYRFT